MSHPVPGHDYSEQHNEETYKEYLARKKAGERSEPLIDKLKRYVGESKEIRKGNLSGKKKELAKKMSSHPWFKSGQGGRGDLPPGRTDKDNE